MSKEDPLIYDDGEASVETVEDPYYTTDEETAHQKVNAGFRKDPTTFESNICPIISYHMFKNNMFFAVLMSVNPWFYIFALLGLYFLFRKYREDLCQRYQDWADRRQAERDVAEMKKNPDKFRAQAEAMEKARRSMQAKYDR